jgi:cell shape-determining protein MreD
MLAAIWQGPVIRLIPVGMILLALQRSLLVEITVAGVIIQVLLALAAAAGAAGGSERGAIAGFVLGVMYDLLEGLPIGSTAIPLTIAGIVAGSLAIIVADPQWWLGMIFTTLGAAVGSIMVPVTRLFTGAADPFEPRLTLVVPVVAISAGLLSPLFIPLARWCLRIKRSEWVAPPRDAEV